jgi:AcrR family transcriptional regulator
LRDQQKAQTRAKVVEAARTLFGEMGFAAATIREIAKRAVVAHGSVTFRSKEELLVEVLEERYTPLREEARAIMAREASFLDRVVQFFAAHALEWPERKLVGEQFWVSWTFEPELDARARARRSRSWKRSTR